MSTSQQTKSFSTTLCKQFSYTIGKLNLLMFMYHFIRQKGLILSKDFKQTLWKTADKLRAQMDAAEYKHIVLVLTVFNI